MRNDQRKSRCAEKKTRLADELSERYGSVQLSIAVVKFYNDGVVQAVTFAYLIY